MRWWKVHRKNIAKLIIHRQVNKKKNTSAIHVGFLQRELSVKLAQLGFPKTKQNNTKFTPQQECLTVVIGKLRLDGKLVVTATTLGELSTRWCNAPFPKGIIAEHRCVPPVETSDVTHLKSIGLAHPTCGISLRF